MQALGRRGPNVKALTSRGDIEGLAAVARSGAEGHDVEESKRPRQVRARVRALEALSQLYGPGAERGVRDGLRDPSAEVRLAAVRAADTARMTNVANGLVAGVLYWEGDELAASRAEADRVLAGWELPDLPERLGEVLAQNPTRELTPEQRLLLQHSIHEDRRDPAACCEAVGARLVAQLSDLNVSGEDVDRTAEVMILLDRGGVESLIELLWTATPPATAIRLAARLRDNRLLEPLVAAFGADDGGVRRLVVEALGAIEDSRGVGVLLRATRDPEHAVRRSANQALEGMGVAAVVFGLAATIRPELTQGSSPEDPTPDELPAGARKAES